MKTHKLILAVVFALILGTFTLGGVASAHSGTADLDIAMDHWWIGKGKLVEKGQVWVDKDGVLHMRDRVERGDIDGSLSGSALLSFSADIDLKSGEGWVWGAAEITLDGHKGVYYGLFSRTITGGKVTSGEVLAFNPTEGLALVVTNIYEQNGNLVHVSYFRKYADR